MGMVLNAKGGGDYTPAPAGTHPAICYGVVDLGTQETTFQGKTKRLKKIRLMFELCNELRDDGKPYSIGGEYTASLAEKASLRKILEQWRGKALSAEDLDGFDIKRVIGKPCMVSVVHEEGQNGTYARIAGVMSPPKGMQYPAQQNPSMVFDIDDWRDEVFDSLPNYLKEKILKSPEGAKARMGAAHGKPANASTANTKAIAQEPEDPFS